MEARPTIRFLPRPGCHLCVEARAGLQAILEERGATGRLPAQVREVDITTDAALGRLNLDRIPVLAVGARGLPPAPPFIAGVISFLSPCVLPVVPAYLGQLGVITVAGAPAGTTDLLGTRRWRGLRGALAFVLGFGAIFTLLGLTVYVGGSIGVSLPLLRQAGGLILIVLGLNMMGVIRLPALGRSRRAPGP